MIAAANNPQPSVDGDKTGKGTDLPSPAIQNKQSLLRFATGPVIVVRIAGRCIEVCALMLVRQIVIYLFAIFAEEANCSHNKTHND